MKTMQNPDGLRRYCYKSSSSLNGFALMEAANAASQNCSEGEQYSLLQNTMER
jgi:hypothetical protein